MQRELIPKKKMLEQFLLIKTQFYLLSDLFYEDIISVLQEIVTKFTNFYNSNKRTKSDAKDIGRLNQSISSDTFFDV